MGPYQTLDTQLEYNTTRGVLRWGYPYLDRFGEPSMDSYGDLFNMPPLGFYTQALHLTIFGSALENGVFLVTLFGLGCTVLVYLLGKEFYGKTTGLFAAAFFALAPWQLILSRAFLIDTQCLFLSLTYLYIGVLAIRRDSVKLAAVSGVFFAAALLTKQFAVFMLIPLAILYLQHRPKNGKLVLSQLSAFILPAAVSTVLWYNVILGRELLYLFRHNDFRDVNFPGITPSYSFASDFLVNYGLGLFFCLAAAFSLAAGLLFWRHFPSKLVVFDFAILAALGSIICLELYMAVNLNLKAPYTSAVKYLYHTLPLFSLAAASLAAKSAALLRSAGQAAKARRILLVSVSLAGLFLLAAPLIADVFAARQLTMMSYLIFRVQPNLDVGYSFHVINPPGAGDSVLAVQFLGFIFVLSGLLWGTRHFLVEQLRLIRYRLKSNNAPLTAEAV
jgi:4-amino-4-deoxy-L-arabinose transferase-like glycosyltransferase